jgi:hypothetical protein
MSDVDALPVEHGSNQASEPSLPATSAKMAALAIEVLIQTSDYEVQGLIHVSREAREDRRLTELINDPDKRFLAVTDARITPRQSEGAPRMYRFLQLRLDDIQMIHPAIQAVSINPEYSNQEAERFNNLRTKLSS